MEFPQAENSSQRKYPHRVFNRALGCLCQGKYTSGHGIDISENEITVALPEALAQGLGVVLNFQVPGGSFISVRAEISEVKKDSEAGSFLLICAFQNLKFEQRREIRSFVSARSEATR